MASISLTYSIYIERENFLLDRYLVSLAEGSKSLALSHRIFQLDSLSKEKSDGKLPEFNKFNVSVS